MMHDNNNNANHHHYAANSDAKPNKLAQETSPYLLQHAYNPVEWYAWGEEALERAKREDKPIFLSVGYSACHWCHVMAHESFEDYETAKIMNDHFISIKVDREERPDIDDIYQRVCQLATGTGGWPLSVFLTPDQKPFYVGTYFPKDGRQYSLPGFKTVLQQLAEAYKSKKNEIEMASAEFMSGLAQTARDVSALPSGEANSGKAGIERSTLDEAAMGLLQMGDTIYGGFGQAPKFPNASNLLFLLRYYDISGISRFRDFVIFTADKMAQGGIFDQLGGGFARYSTDQKWLVPHFEKMLYDNALLAQLYSELFQITKDERHLSVVRKTLDFVVREMTHPEGGFYSAQDADSEGEEGKFYLWTKKEIRDALQHDQLAIDAFCERYGVTEGGNFEFKNILNVRSPIASIAQRHSKTANEISRIIEESVAKLFAVREKRVRPGRDEKVLVSWNGLMISGFAKGYAVTGDRRYLEAAKNAVRFIESKLATRQKEEEEDGRLLRTFKDGQSKLNAYLDDYAFYTSGLLDLFAVDSKPDYLAKAAKYTQFMIKHFWDDKEGNLFFTSDDHEQLIVRTKSFYDLAIPSGNSVAASNLLRLYHYTQNNDYLDKATRIMKSGARPAAENPFGFGQLLIAIYMYVKKPVEVTVIEGRSDDNGTAIGIMSGWLRAQFLPDGITAFVTEKKDLQVLQRYPFFQGKSAEGSEAAFVCRNFTCSLPITTEKELERQLGQR
ncbi:MAG TPA: thioredoxin domain-containing protein [Nitrososphaera sp.]|nr:thioredoxin domain-containing protein [Nitrososphaera sp.]